MKKIIVSMFALFVYFSFSTPVSAQNVTREQFAKVFSEYRTKYDEYVVLHEKYVLSKKQYEQYKTLSSKENLQKDIQKMLSKRDEVLITYLRAVMSKMDDSLVTIPEDRKNEYFQKLTDEITWITDHRNSYKENDSLQALSVKSEETDLRFQTFQKDLLKCLYYIARGKIVTYGERHNFLYNDLYSLTEKIKNEQREAYKLSESKIDTIYRWFGELNTKNGEFGKLLDSADSQFTREKVVVNRGVYDTAIKILNNSMVVFFSRITITKEIIREIKVSES